MAINYKKLTTVLEQSELLSPEELIEAQAKSRERNIPLEQVLVDGEYIGDENLGQLIADILGFPFVSLKKQSLNEDTVKIIPELVARRKKIIAFSRDKSGIKVAMVDPENEELVQFLRKKSGENVIPYYATLRDLNEALIHYRKGIKEEFKSIIDENVAATQNKSGDDRELPVTRIIDTVLEYAYENKASDIHIEPHDDQVSIRFRIDGILHDVVSLPKDIHPYLITRVKILSSLRTDEHRSAQDGRLEFMVEGEKVDVRVSIIPISDGEKVVMRLLAEKSRQYKLQELGLENEDFEKVERAFKKPYGMLLATGPTGSGKTTTLYAILKVLNTRKVNISTIEDPVEYDVEGINQIQVNTKTNLTFATGLRSILRQDPDIIMVGEIRDEETAGIAINSAMTGHLVLSTLHANDAPTTLPRLLDMKIEPFLIATTVNIVIAQRLVRRIHQRCMESYIPSPEELDTLKAVIGKERFEMFGKDIRLYRGKGCKLCGDTGYEGRIGIYEVLEVDDDIKSLIMKHENSEVIRVVAIKNGMTTMLDDGLNKAKRGITTIEEVLRVTKE